MFGCGFTEVYHNPYLDLENLDNSNIDLFFCFAKYGYLAFFTLNIYIDLESIHGFPFGNDLENSLWMEPIGMLVFRMCVCV